MSDSLLRRPRVAIAGGGISGLATAYQLAAQDVPFTLFEATDRLGGIVETVHAEGFVIECGPDSWVTEKPWARELANELGLAEQCVPSNDRGRRTYVQVGEKLLTHLVPVPDGMRMMVPSRWAPVLESPLFNWQARLGYLREIKRAEELLAAAPARDESVASFVRRHFGEEVVTDVAAPLLGAVFGGDIEHLSVRSVMPNFVRMEAEHGSLIHAVQQATAMRGGEPIDAIFTTLLGGLETLVHALARTLPPHSVRRREPVLRLAAQRDGWRVVTAHTDGVFDAVVLATPVNHTRELLLPLGEKAAGMARLLPQQTTSAIVVAMAFAPDQAARMRVPRGFGFIVPQAQSQDELRLLACTFVDQKFPGRVPEGAVLLRAFFGGAAAEALLAEPDGALMERARLQLARVLGPLPPCTLTVVRRWPASMPQYGVGHLDRMAELEGMLTAFPGLHLVGSAYRGVGLPDLVRLGRATGRLLVSQPATART